MLRAQETMRLLALRHMSLEDLFAKGLGRSVTYVTLNGSSTATPAWAQAFAQIIGVSVELLEECLNQDGIVVQDRRSPGPRPTLQTSYVRPSRRAYAHPREQAPSSKREFSIVDPVYKRVGANRLVIRGVTSAVAVGSRVEWNGETWTVLYCAEDVQGYLVRAKRVMK